MQKDSVVAVRYHIPIDIVVWGTVKADTLIVVCNRVAGDCVAGRSVKANAIIAAVCYCV